jgi:hypothetical protein
MEERREGSKGKTEIKERNSDGEELRYEGNHSPLNFK